jgi:hypothetical protein
MTDKVSKLLNVMRATPFAGERRNAINLILKLSAKKNNWKKWEIYPKNDCLYLFCVVLITGMNGKYIDGTVWGTSETIDEIKKYSEKFLQDLLIQLETLKKYEVSYVNENLIHWIAGYAIGVSGGKSHVESKKLPYSPCGVDVFCMAVSQGEKVKLNLP